MVSWAGKEGWNPGLHDAECFYNIDPKGFFIGFLDEIPVSCISAVSYKGKFGFIGFYITTPKYRGKGYGLQVWNKAIEHLKNQNIGLDGVVEQQRNYKKSSFKFAYNNARYLLYSKKFKTTDLTLKPAKEVSFNKLIDYDKKHFFTERSRFLKYWITQPECQTLVKIRNNQIQGFGMIRKCYKGYKIGPLFADNFIIAESLLRSLINKVRANSQVTIDIPEINKDAARLVNKHKMEKVFSTARMYTKKAPKLPINNIFGITTYEVG